MLGSVSGGHGRAFEFFTGVPRRISYDNTKVAVAKIVGDRERERTKEFQRLVGHFLFEPHFCLVGGRMRRDMSNGRWTTRGIAVWCRFPP